MATAEQTQAGAVSYQYLDDKLSAIIYLLNTTNMTPKQIQAGAVCYQCMTDKLSAIIFLLAGGGGGSGGTGGSVTFGNYAGGQPTFTPASGFGLAVDTSDGTLWEYYGGAWH